MHLRQKYKNKVDWNYKMLLFFDNEILKCYEWYMTWTKKYMLLDVFIFVLIFFFVK